MLARAVDSLWPGDAVASLALGTPVAYPPPFREPWREGELTGEESNRKGPPELLNRMPVSDPEFEALVVLYRTYGPESHQFQRGVIDWFRAVEARFPQPDAPCSAPFGLGTPAKTACDSVFR